MENPHDILLADWAHWNEEAAKQEGSWRPKVTMATEEVAPGYAAQICIRKKDNTGTNSFDSHVSRAIIVNTNTAKIVFDSGEWKRPHLVRKALDKAKLEVQAMAGKP